MPEYAPAPRVPWPTTKTMSSAASGSHDPQTAVAGNHAVAGAEEMDAEGQMKQAMCYRVKYRKDEKKQRLSIWQLGVQMLNRGPLEVYPNGQDVVSLGVEVTSKCFDQAEADHNGIAVEEVPMDIWLKSPKNPVDDTKPLLSLKEYNKQMTAGSKCLDTCFSDESRGSGSIIAWGTLAHSHLLLVLLCYATGAKWGIVDDKGKPKYPSGKDGRLDKSAVAEKDRVSRNSSKTGWRWRY